MAVNIKIQLLKKEWLKNDILKFTCKSEEIANQAMPGQFIEVKVSKTYEPFLKRPISIFNTDKSEGIVEFIFQLKGKGTELLSQINEGEFLEVVGPLGLGTFNVKDYKNVAIIGGGIGVFPLYNFIKTIHKDVTTNTYLGFRNKDYVVLEEEFKNISSNLTVTTDDGSYGKSGFAINYLKQDMENNKIDAIFACGPLPMLKSVKELAETKNIYCQISLEQRMACGIGACMGCSVKLAECEEYARVCKDGPVFDSTTVQI